LIILYPPQNDGSQTPEDKNRAPLDKFSPVLHGFEPHWKEGLPWGYFIFFDPGLQ
jgi:hypothetical protein